MYNKLNLLSDSSERIPYNCTDSPISIRKRYLSSFLNSTITNHWHDDIEFCMIQSGKMSYNVNGDIVQLKQGEGIFINFRQFHGNFSSDDHDCEYISIVFHPMLLSINQALESTYVTPVITNDGFHYELLDQTTPWKKQLLSKLLDAYNLFNAQKETYILQLISTFFDIWHILYANMPEEDKHICHTDSRLSTLREMTGYLQKNYTKKITLSEIAAAGNVCQSTCCEIFNKYLHQSPIQHLNQYRLSKSAELLKNTSFSITEVALASGFTGVSYYTESFRKHFNCTPTEYRKKSQININEPL